MLDWVRASACVWSVVCVIKRVVVINRNVLFNSADYNMIINVTRADSLTTSSAGITVCSFIVIFSGAVCGLLSRAYVVSSPL